MFLSVIKEFFYELILFWLLVQRLDITVKFPIVLINRVNFRSLDRFLIDHHSSNLDINQVLDEIKFLLNHLMSLDSEIAHVLHAKVMWDVSVEPRWEICKVSIGLAVQDFFDLTQVLVSLHNSFFVELA